MNLVHRSVTDTMSRTAAAESGEGHPQPGPETRPPGEKQKTVVREGEKVGRNDPCPCGSGKKYKKCCGVTAATG
jgi:preprotein translocase subunit SecA